MDTLLQIVVGNAILACLLAVPAGIVSLFGRRPALAHGLWLLVLLKLVTPPVVHFNLPPLAALQQEPPATASEPTPIPESLPVIRVESEALPDLEIPDRDFDEPPASPAATPQAAVTPPLPEPIAETPTGAFLTVTLLGIWAAGSVGWLGLMIVRIQRFRRLLRHAKPAPAELVADVADLARRLGVARPPEVLLVPGPVSPMVWGLVGLPRLLVPVDLLDRLDGEQLATLLAHELAHLRRRDHWVRLLELLATGLYWWHPVVWIARKAIREAEEECCDAWVVWLFPEAAKSYAGALLETVIFLTDAVAVPPVASGVGPFPVLKRRLTMIMRGTRPRSLSAAGVLGVMGLGLALLPWAPSWAQNPTDPLKSGPARDAIWVEVQSRKDAKPEEIEKAALEAKKAVEELQRARAQLHDAEKRFLDAQRRLVELTGADGKVLMLGGGDARTKVLIRGDFPPPPPPGGVRSGGVRGESAPVEGKLAEELGVLTAQLKGKEAMVQEAQAQLALVQAKLKRVQELHKQAAVPTETVEAALGEVRTTQAQLAVKLAELEEVRVRFDAAKKRLPQAEAPGNNPTERAMIFLQRLQAAQGNEGERRLQDVERKLTELLKEVQGLRHEMNRPSTRTMPPAPPGAPTPPPQNP